ncbi:uncharacterized domain 1-containing protein [Fulvimarina manganoxydans]|uniref:Uncharacterized domain 1-containing protein n=1 Tax=Fulvimarina manganoxydans TaxID=937218 RepID=A0A1W2D9J6_9HYPH|nr:PaaI family thioesterase [Fulvimarina manganoxydans]SMC94237.1 uncharacterized domain 1-containing protein [Fulvimarina manganoxydans]
MQPIMTTEELNAFLASHFPQVSGPQDGMSVTQIGAGHATLRLEATDKHLRPGGTVSGPSMFLLADVAAYVAILAHIGPVALAVTTNMTINFMRKPEPGPLLGKASLLKLGKRLAVCEIALVSEREAEREGEAELAAHAVATYSIPPR